MAKQKRKAPASKPVTQHQLFPAVVALWFGALFGLGSLAVRPGLVEELVIKSRIDLIVPAAAPPLGVTARMLIALCLAALGAMIGAVIGRRLARPKVEARERKRSNLATPAEAPVARYQQADALEVSATPANRRRALAIEEEEAKFVPLDLAPPAGTRVLLREGCDRTIDTCSSRFANAINFQGEPFLPGNDQITRYPSPGQ